MQEVKISSSLMQWIQLGVVVCGLVFGALILRANTEMQARLLTELKLVVKDVDARQRQNEIDDAKRDGRIEAIQQMNAQILSNLRPK